jgi:hypothetical protein
MRGPNRICMGTLLVGVPPWSSGVSLPREAAGARSPVQQGPQDWQHITHEYTLRASVYKQVHVPRYLSPPPLRANFRAVLIKFFCFVVQCLPSYSEQIRNF